VPRAAPLIVFVGGAPGAGKTTLAVALAAALGLPLVAKDAIKEPLMDILGAPDIEASRRIGRATYAVLFALAGAAVSAGSGVVVESNFHRERSAEALVELAARGRAVFVHCVVPDALRRARYATRARHPGHFDRALLAAWDDDVSIFEPPDRAGIERIDVDTSGPVDVGALARCVAAGTT